MKSITDSIVRQVGAGFERPDGDRALPLDINYAKLSEWLVDRKQVPSDWLARLKALQAQGAAAARELPAGLLSSLEGGEEAPLDYNRAVLGRLTEEGAGAEKSFLGSYKGAAGVWERLLRGYEGSMLHVAEAAQALGRNVDYEAVSRAQQQLADLEKRKVESARSATAAAADFAAECKALGVDPRAIRPSLLALAAGLPAAVGSAVARLRAEGVGEGMGYYAAFVGASAPGDGGAAGAGAAATKALAPAELLPTLAEVREGRAAPPSAEALAALEAAASAGEAAAAAAGGGVDWGSNEVSGAGAALDSGMSWDVGPEAAGGAAGGGISWDFELQAEAPLEDAGSGEAAEGAEPAGISWDIDVSGAGETAAPEAAQSPAAAPSAIAPAEGPGAAVAAAEATAPAEVRRLIADHDYRSRLLDDLHELLAFLTQRCSELSTKGSELLAAGAPDAVARVSADVAVGMRDAVRAAIAAFDDEALRRLLAIRTSARHVDRLAAALGKKGGQEAKFKRMGQEAEAKRDEVQRQLMADATRLAALAAQTRRAKALAEAALGTRLGRRINIQGGDLVAVLDGR